MNLAEIHAENVKQIREGVAEKPASSKKATKTAAK